jgi:carboxyl-terminal processing protease
MVEALIDFDDRKVKKIIIDLRSNGGGDINTALSIADSFISKGELLTINYKNSDPEVYNARSQTLVDSDVKVALLTNGQTASSSEILTGAMKDNNRATIIGTKTYGKGIMQVVSPFDQGYISLTEASFVTASHNEIHGVGIEPDILVPELEMTDEEAESYTNVYNDGVIADYVDAHPDFTDENIEAFKLDPKYGEIRHEILRILVRYEYINRLPGDQQFLIDPNYDQCLKTAVDFLNGETI